MKQLLIKSIFTIFFLLLVIKLYQQGEIGFQLEPNQSVVFGSDMTNIGSKFMWIAPKSAIRIGLFENNGSSDYNSIGHSSIAFGTDVRASGTTSAAIGYYNKATGISSIALGHSTTASGNYATALGAYTISSGHASYAHGEQVTASGNYSTAIGKEVSTNNQQGAIIIGDSDPSDQGWTYCGQSDQFVARFANGYYFKTSTGNTPWTGVQVLPGGSSWLTISDKNLKTNFENLNDQDILTKLSSIQYTSWNYKGQDPENKRHYGIMAQDFYHNFGSDTYGIIGNDKMVNPIDMIGITMSAIKGASELITVNQKIIKTQNKTISKLSKQVRQLETQNRKAHQLILDLTERVAQIETTN